MTATSAWMSQPVLRRCAGLSHGPARAHLSANSESSARSRSQVKALIIVDMLNDFVTGAVPNEVRAMRIVPSVRRLLDHARTDPEWLVVYANDAHRADDREVEMRGRHAMAGTPGAMVIEPLAPIGVEREIVVPKRFYGAFDGTDLDDTLVRLRRQRRRPGWPAHGLRDPAYRLRRLLCRLCDSAADGRGLRDGWRRRDLWRWTSSPRCTASN